METVHEGGCLCGSIRYKTTAEPQRVTICHCTFCQRFTGTAFLVEPIFRKVDVAFSGKKPRTYDHQSDGSNKRVTLNFCGTCGTTLFLDLERFPDILGLCAGTFDDPNWFDRSQGKCRHIFTRSAQKGVVLPPGIDTYEDHAMQIDGTPNQPVVFAHAVMARHG
ncbi:MAG: GFA family protein [Proteobacteria bacterium]|nr:GFA family protein [Pseudomonadota bacterium]MCH8097451.1 GFA family protein [Pseudomonadota bacterium]